eukprot:gnl/TRDRNA2_/TRDRNA2_140871_c0_seq1.p1 gnl/TRDRNA2_/TRDRNA2_140871_c0~~gnl/TRDRNA2_/TRDRNA2_140871_c0_seq1.p1  ORF type:complete len:276 (+),score=52.53 gnl/TRDRNA2_/TRDRNA2_140871_c0_seq1:84-911(+)
MWSFLLLTLSASAAAGAFWEREWQEAAENWAAAADTAEEAEAVRVDETDQWTLSLAGSAYAAAEEVQDFAEQASQRVDKKVSAAWTVAAGAWFAASEAMKKAAKEGWKAEAAKATAHAAATTAETATIVQSPEVAEAWAIAAAEWQEAAQAMEEGQGVTDMFRRTLRKDMAQQKEPIGEEEVILAMQGLSLGETRTNQTTSPVKNATKMPPKRRRPFKPPRRGMRMIATFPHLIDVSAAISSLCLVVCYTQTVIMLRFCRGSFASGSQPLLGFHC